MAMFQTFREWESRYALTFGGFLVGVLGTVFAIYVYLQKTTPNLRMEVVSNANVLDIKEGVTKLDIIYDGVNLREKQETLALVTLKFSNNGAAAIPKGAYDENSPVGVQVTSGEITKAELIQASTAYLTTNINFRIASGSAAVFSPVILEPGDEFQVKLLVLHKEKIGFSLHPIGKIAGVKEIGMVGPNGKEPQPVVRKLSTEFPFKLMVVIGGATFVLVLLKEFGPVFLELFKRRKRRAEVATFSSNAAKTNGEYEWVQNLYIRGGRTPILTLYHLLQTPERVFELADWAAPVSDASKRQVRNRAVQLLKQNVVKKTDGKVVVDEECRAFVTDFTKIICRKDSAEDLKLEFPY